MQCQLTSNTKLQRAVRLLAMDQPEQHRCRNTDVGFSLVD